ncbi:Protein of unknown function [Halogranum gelatinilyticum]|uniref:DUF1059 domain-containing protein n=1 Tax=Halogranum gelatinilyticum TaxID=660521 RepID=A0A1G9VU28_9EURY|nr:DUF1059 domain-containing protein [Halogranum gelatinilyticum]SDM75447.1 Protein of unknown function [Halogranum gelatinilyticum]
MGWSRKLVCRPGCPYEVTSEDDEQLVAVMLEHMWDDHGVAVDPEDLREMISG